MWIQRWLGKIYSSLYYSFELDTFTFEDAEKEIKIDRGKLNIAFSYLHKAGCLPIFKRSRPRIYRLMDPNNYLLISSGKVNLIRIKQERYLNLIYSFFRQIRKLYNLKSYAVYGSVARGEARENSDVDILIISNDFSGSLSSRLDELYECIKSVGEELRWLSDKGIYTNLSIYPLTEDEADKIPILFIDIAHEAKIVYDDGYLDRLLNRIRGRLAILGAERVKMSNGRWYWVLKKDIKPYEVIDI